MTVPLLSIGLAATIAGAITIAAANTTANTSAGDVAAQTQAQAQAQQPAAAPSPDSLPEGPRLRIGVTAVEIDAVITDRGGRPITDLRPDEVEILQDGRKQQVMSALYIPLDPPVPRESAVAGAASTAPPERLPRPADVRHTMAIVIDDLNLSFISTASLQQALRTFIDRSVQPGDLIAIIRTGRGVGRFTPFTSDKRVLHAAVSRIRYNLMAGAIEDDGGMRETTDTLNRAFFTTPEAFQSDIFTAGALGAVSFVIRGMRDMPGRKSVLLVNDGFALTGYQKTASARRDEPVRSWFLEARPHTVEAMQRLVDEANRSFVVIYTVDARGLVSTAPDASERDLPSADEANDRNQLLLASYEGPQMLASLSGGLFFRSNNSLSTAFARAMDDQRGYYLIGYQPDARTFEKADRRAKFNRVKIRVTRPGARIRSRSGFFGITDEELKPTPPAAHGDRLLASLATPFGRTDVGVRATSLFWRHPDKGPVVRALVYVDTRTLTFRPAADAGADAAVRMTNAPIELVAALVDERGTIVSSKILTFTLNAADPPSGAMLDEGIVYAVDLPVLDPGPYQLRAGVRDVNADRMGSANEFVIVPRTEGRQFAVSGVMLQGNEASASPAVRRFTPGTELNYQFQVYNAQRDETTGKPVLKSRYRLFREGRLVKEGSLDPQSAELPAAPRSNVKGVVAVGELTLAASLSPGEYDMELAVSDTLAKKDRPAVQWTTFTVSPR
jgi:VWFA-related protein